MTSSPGERRRVRLRCRLSLPADSALVARRTDETVTVRLVINDVSLADAPAELVAEAEVVVPVDQALAGPFDIDADLPRGRQLAVSAHLDRAGDGTLAAGDLITTVRVPVPDSGERDAVFVDVPLTELT